MSKGSDRSDADGDGYSVADGDCWDVPGPVIIDGVQLAGDGAEIHPGAADEPYDGLDADCAGDDDFDADGDGFVPAAYLGATIANVPGFDPGSRAEQPDCADTEEQLLDDDAHAPVAGVELPDPAEIFPGAPADTFYDGVDQDCAGGDDFDQDGDGHASADHPQASGAVGTDCDDLEPAINPGALEACDDIDNDCDGAVDGDDEDFDTSTLRTFYADLDGDGFGDPDTAVESCSAVAGHVEDATDCDDSRGDVSPAADEVCDDENVDEDCDGLADDADDSALDEGMTDVWADGDGDSYGDPEAGARFCDPDPDHWVANSDDCDDRDGLINPGVAEICDTGDVDEDCSGAADDGDPGVDAATQTVHYRDGDGDGYGDPDASELRCDPGSAHAAVAGDCNDGDGAIHPGATEVCDAADVDEDCDGLADDDDSSVDPTTQFAYYEDADGDGYGDASGSAVAFCDGDAPADRVTDSSDCDDGDSAVHPGASEVCDGDDVDEDCDGLADDDDPSVDSATQLTRYADSDGDGFGDDADPGSLYCDPPSSVVDDNTDCDDADGAIHPDATEVCDSADTDENCNGLADGADPTLDLTTRTTFYSDDDGDGYGDEADSGSEHCDGEEPSGLVTDATDCDDVDSSIHPGATEICDADDVDEDCDGLSDDDDGSLDTSTQTAHYPDSDSDGYGDLSASAVLYCAGDAPADWVTDNTDCDDVRDDVSPAGTEVCDDEDADEDCDGVVEDADSSVDPTTQLDHFVDADGDGHGEVGASAVLYCPGGAPSGLVTTDDDCDDTDAAISPSATEVCDGADVDEDCDGLADDADDSVDPTTQTDHHVDDDGDGYGELGSVATLYCAGDAPSGVVADATDCDDGDILVHPGATEVCDADDTDENCNGLADDADATLDLATRTTHYTDADGDGYGDASATVLACDESAGVVLDATDCDDTSAAASPAGVETCNDGFDGDCDGSGLTEGGDPTPICAFVDDELEMGPHVGITDAASEGLGWALAVADLDGSGDGVLEVVIGAPVADYDGLTASGGAWLVPDLDGEVWNENTGDSLDLDSTATTGTAALLTGEEDEGWAGASLAAGDIDNDGIADLLVGAPGANRNGSGANPQGAVYVLEGPVTAFTGAASLSTTTATDGDTTHGLLGNAMAVGGDADGDGISGDMLIASMACAHTMPSPDTTTFGGKVFVVDGGAGLPATLGTSTSDYYWQGVECGGWAVAWWDADGDGTPSAAISEPTRNEGRIYVDDVDPAGTSALLSAVDVLKGASGSAQTGEAFGVGDLDNDGYDELIVAAQELSGDKDGVWIVPGSATFAYSNNARINSLATSSIVDDTNNTELGHSISVVPDVDGDGYDELLLGGLEGGGDNGEVWLVYGPFSGTMAVNTVDTVMWTGEKDSYAGAAVWGEDDLNGDGYSDLLVGAPYDDHATAQAGRVFLLPGLGL
jgi:hypothetical protein